MFHSSPQPAATSVFALGKYVGYSEFLRAEADGDAVETFDEWVERGAIAAHERWGHQWAATFPMGSAYGFLWTSPRDATCLCGIIAPSRDAVGRDYPLTIAARFPVNLVQWAPHSVPLAYGEFLDSAYQLVDEARTNPMTVAELTARVRGLAAATVQDMQRAEAEYSWWCNNTPLGQGWGAIFPGADPFGRAARAIHVLDTVLAPYRGREVPETPLVLRLPLGAGGVAAAALWIDIVRKICRWSRTVPSGFWGLDDGVLLLPVGRPPYGAYAELWRPDPSGEVSCDIANLDDQAVPSSRFRDRAQGFARAGGDTPMSAFLESLAL